jgi:[ribosomal protein S5]-alanine N-acetyltransferase
MSKHDLQARPIYHHERDSIKAHLTIAAGRQPLDRTCRRLDDQEIRPDRPLPDHPDSGRRPTPSPLPNRYPTTCATPSTASTGTVVAGLGAMLAAASPGGNSGGLGAPSGYSRVVPELQRLNAGHAPAVLTFELANRAYFAASVSDRGDDFFEQYTDRHSALLAEQEAGICAFYVLVAEDGSVLGRFNLFAIEDRTAELGYRVAQHIAGRGVATATVRELCGLAASRHGLRTLKAATARENAASLKVLTKAGFVPVGPADPAHLGGKPGTWYQRDLSAG